VHNEGRRIESGKGMGKIFRSHSALRTGLGILSADARAEYFNFRTHEKGPWFRRGTGVECGSAEFLFN
jgi:hypothetical protein